MREKICRAAQLPQNILQEERWQKAIPRGSSSPGPWGAGLESYVQCSWMMFHSPCMWGTSKPKCLHPVYRRNGLWGRNPHIRMLCVEKKLYTPFLPVLQKKEFYFLKSLMLNLFQTRPCGAFQRGFIAALGRQCQRTLDFWSLIWKNASNSDPSVTFSKFHAIISYCTSSWHYIWSYPSSYPSDGSHELPHLSNSSLS